MKAIKAMVSMGLVAALVGCGAATEGQTETESENPTPAPTATPEPNTPAQLRPSNLRGAISQGVDAYEPNDVTPYYLGAGLSYTVSNGYIDPVDVSWTVDVVNDGSAVAGAVEVMLHVGPVTLVQSLGGIAAGETKPVVFTMSDVTPGTLTASVEVDSRNDVDESDEADNASPAVELAIAGDVDRYSVYQISGRTLGVTLDQLPADYDVQLLTPSGTVFASSSMGALNAESINTTANVSGQWIVKIVGYNGARSGAYPYRLKITAP